MQLGLRLDSIILDESSVDAGISKLKQVCLFTRFIWALFFFFWVIVQVKPYFTLQAFWYHPRYQEIIAQETVQVVTS